MRKLIFVGCFIVCTSLFANAKDQNPGIGDTKKTDINGGVYNADTKKPIRDVNVTAYLTSTKEKVILTDTNGNYVFDDLKPGTYKFVFEKNGFQKVVKERVTIRTDEAFQMNIEMIEDPDFEFLPGTLRFLEF
ncbi:MAG: carboxypeptidase regulatory-like domain-containing protein [Chitinophagaceae bacterium]|nr:carboxypeptidase regulatory-like domain-containing protein [Chitinophagaceae bacterium]